jgi:prolyl oligopeptidase
MHLSGALVMSTIVAAAAAPPVETRRDPVVEVLHGQKIADPYRWLEEGDAPEVAAWTEAQNAHTRRVLDAVPGRARLEERLWQLHEIGSLGPPVPRPLPGRRGRWRYFYTRRDGKQNQPVLYVRDGLEGTDRPLVDVNALSAEGTRSLDWWFPSEDGRRVAYGVSADGSEESVLRVRDVASGKDLADVIPRTRACSVAWLPDGRGFFYTRYPAPASVPAAEEKYHRHVFFHRLGVDPVLDREVFGSGRDMKDWPSVALAPGGRWLAVEVSQGWSKTEVHLLDLGAAGAKLGPRDAVTAAPLGPALPVAAGEEAIFDVAEVLDDALLVRTNSGAPRYRLLRVPLARSGAAPERASWQELIPEGPFTLQQVGLVGRTLGALYLEDAASRVRLHATDGKSVGEVTLPTLGTVAGLYGHRDGAEMFLPFTSFLVPTAMLRQPLAPHRSSSSSSSSSSSPSSSSPTPSPPPLPAPAVWRALRAPVAADDFVVSAERYRSKDGGAEIPLFLVHKRGLARDGNNPTVLYGYGGFNVNITPGWTPSAVPFLERGGVWAVAVLRGGGEYGEAWHRAGMLEKKQTVFDDFVAAALHLVSQKVTRPERLAIAGRSNGGLLVGAALTQRPDLFRAVVCGVPLLDMLRYHRFRIAQLWIPEYGSPDDAAAFKWLAAYSPYHRVRDGTAYPAVLLATAASDTRVDPLHARKMAARLQAATGSDRPILLRLETKAGHGAGKPLGKVIAQTVDEWSFLMSQLGVDIRVSGK